MPSSSLDNLNQTLRRLRQYKGEKDWASSLLDGVEDLTNQVGVFVLHGDTLSLIAERGLGVEAGYTISLASASAFSGVVDSKDPVIALRTSHEVGPELSSPEVWKRAHIIPVTNKDRVVALLYATADEGTDVSGLELVTGIASLVLEQARNVSTTQIDPAPARASVTSDQGERRQQKLPEWAALAAEQREFHGRAQRFARRRVAEMCIARSAAMSEGFRQRNVYVFLKEEIERARNQYRAQFMARPGMCDYLHNELVRSVAAEDESRLGEDYPGQLV